MTNTLVTSSSTTPGLIPRIVELDSVCTEFAGIDVGNEVDMTECPDEFDEDLLQDVRRFSFLPLRFWCQIELLNEKSPAAELLRRTPDVGELNEVGVAGDDDDVDKDAKLEVDEVIDVLKALLHFFLLFFALEFDVLYEKYGVGK